MTVVSHHREDVRLHGAISHLQHRPRGGRAGAQGMRRNVNSVGANWLRGNDAVACTWRVGSVMS